MPIDTQTALLNSRPLTGDEIEDTRSATEQFQEWAHRISTILGGDLKQDVPNDNPALVAALKKIADAGCPEPIRAKNTIAYPGGGGMFYQNETLVFTHFQNPRLQYSAGEAWLELNPEIAIAEMKALGIRAKQD